MQIKHFLTRPSQYILNPDEAMALRRLIGGSNYLSLIGSQISPHGEGHPLKFTEEDYKFLRSVWVKLANDFDEEVWEQTQKWEQEKKERANEY